MAQPQPIHELNIGTLAAIVASETRKAFPSEQFLDEELSRIIGGVLNAFNWGLIRMAIEQGFGPEKQTVIESLETDEGLSTRWMKKGEIILHAMDTTGLPGEVVSFAFRQIEAQIDLALRVNRYVRVGWLGTIRRSAKSQVAYHIALSEDLRFPSTV